MKRLYEALMLLEAILSKQDIVANLAARSYPATVYDELAALDPSRSKKYVGWLVWTQSIDYVLSHKNETVALLKAFEHALPKLADKQRDIYSYEKFEDVQQAIDDAFRKSVTSKVPENGAKHLASGDGYEIYKIEDAAACVLVSSGTKWCVSALATAEDYYEKGNELYLIFKNGKKYAMLVIDTENSKVSAFDLKDSSIGAFDADLLNLLSGVFHGDVLRRIHDKFDSGALALAIERIEVVWDDFEQPDLPLDISGWFNGVVTIGRKSFRIGGGWVDQSGDFTAYRDNELEGIEDVIEALGLDEDDETKELVSRKIRDSSEVAFSNEPNNPFTTTFVTLGRDYAKNDAWLSALQDAIVAKFGDVVVDSDMYTHGDTIYGPQGEDVRIWLDNSANAYKPDPDEDVADEDR